MTKKNTTEQRWREQSEAAKIKAAERASGRLKNQLLREARQLETASLIGKWLSSSGLQPPT
jgi:hypothetical protein